jgi:hypothetical protein
MESLGVRSRLLVRPAGGGRSVGASCQGSVDPEDREPLARRMRRHPVVQVILLSSASRSLARKTGRSARGRGGASASTAGRGRARAAA